MGRLRIRGRHSPGTGSGEDRVIELGNEFLELRIRPSNGGRIDRLVFKAEGTDRVHPHNGFLLDMFMRQPYPGELQDAPYEFDIIDERPRRVGVRLRRTAGQPPHDGIRIFKTVWVEAGRQSVHLGYQFLNASNGYRSFSYWTQHFAVAGRSEENDLYLRPAAGALDAVPFPGGDAYVDVVERPGAGWTAIIDPLEAVGTAFQVDFNYLRWLYNAFPASTVEWFTDQITIAPGQSWTTEFDIIPFDGFRGLRFASAALLADAEIVGAGGGELLIQHRLQAVSDPIENLTVRASARNVGGDAVEHSLVIDVVATEPIAVEQRVAFDTAGRQAVVEISFGEEGALGRYFMNLPDADGKTDQLADLRPAPPKIKEYPDQPESFALRGDETLDLLVLAGPGAKRFQIDRVRELKNPGTVRWSWYNSRVIMNAQSHGVDYFPRRLRRVGLLRRRDSRGARPIRAGGLPQEHAARLHADRRPRAADGRPPRDDRLDGNGQSARRTIFRFGTRPRSRFVLLRARPE